LERVLAPRDRIGHDDLMPHCMLLLPQQQPRDDQDAGRASSHRQHSRTAEPYPRGSQRYQQLMPRGRIVEHFAQRLLLRKKSALRSASLRVSVA
jgi:hypothetical protein